MSRPSSHSRVSPATTTAEKSPQKLHIIEVQQTEDDNSPLKIRRSGSGGGGSVDYDVDVDDLDSNTKEAMTEEETNTTSNTTMPQYSNLIGSRDNMSTDETSSIALSSNGPYQIIEYDPVLDEMMMGLEAPLTIEENTPAAEAIRANANVHVSTFGKAARAVHMQTLRRFVKKATGATKSGVVRGKPPRIPEQPSSDSDMMLPSMAGGALGVILDTVEEDDDDGNDEFQPTERDHFRHVAATESDSSAAKNKPSRIQPPFVRSGMEEVDDKSDTAGDGASATKLTANKSPPITATSVAAKTVATKSTVAFADGTRGGDASTATSGGAGRDYYSPQQQNRSHDPHHGLSSSLAQDEHLPDTVVIGTAEASRKVLGTVDPHDLIKLLRWRRKKKGRNKQLQQKSYVKGKVIDGEHELYTLSIAVMIGVRTSISKTNAEINDGPGRRWVRPEDFGRTEKYEFRPKGGANTPAHQLAHTFKVKDYAPIVFAYLRRLAGVNEFDFLLSVCGNANFIEFISNAKSGQFFFYSSDGRFMIKTMTNAESKFLRRMLPYYFRHCVENPNTMMTRFFGMYRVKLYHLRRNVKFVIMNSVYYTDKYLQMFYDLKGSVIGRDAKPGQAVKKDNDLRRRLPDEALALPKQQRARVRRQITKDCKFLESMEIMDYSMLVGVHHVPHTDDRSIATSGFQGNRSSRRHLRQEDDSLGESLNSLPDNETNGSPTRPGMVWGSTQDSNGTPLSPLRFDNSDNEGSLRRADELKMHHQRQLSDNIGAFLSEAGLDEDDSSYLLGSPHRPLRGHDTSYNADSERKKQHTVEKLYWPFHRLYDIHGFRRMYPVCCPTCHVGPCICHEKEDAKILKGYNIPKFVAPLSERKDNGLEMDTTGYDMPMVYQSKQGPQLFGGKIFYMGIIDVLQEYTSRKVVETKYRKMQTQGRILDASCVAPDAYGERFIKFFDEYTKGKQARAEEGIEISESGEVLGDSVRSYHLIEL